MIFILDLCYETYRDEKKILYVLKDSSLFSKTDYVLQFSNSSFFLPCYKFEKNGTIQFLFVVEPFISLAVWMEEINSDLFFTIFSKLISELIEIKQNELFYSTNIVLNWDSVFVDIQNYKIYFMYIPILPSRNCIMIEQVLLKMLGEAIESSNRLRSYHLVKFYHNLSQSLLPLEQWRKHIEIRNIINKSEYNALILQGENLPIHMEIPILKKDYLIGKRKGEVDIDLSFNPTVSRRHCKIVFEKDAHYIMDLDSKNGTFLNRNRLRVNEKHRIKAGDELRIASSCFKVQQGRNDT